MSTFVLLLSCLASLLDSPPVDLNRAGEEELCSLPGIGPVKAAAIMEYREAFGPFLALDDLLDVPGIGSSTLEEIAPFVILTPGEETPRDLSHWLLPVDTLIEPVLTVAVLDVGEGDAVILRATEGSTALVDGGPDDGGPLAPAVILRLSEQGVDSLGCIFLTHPHEDHVGGLDDVVASMPVGVVYDPGMAFPSPAYVDFLETIDAEGCRYASLDSGDVVSLSDSVCVTVLDGGNDWSGDGVNESSTVLLVTCGGFSLLLPGDIEEDAERKLAARAEPVTAMLIPHHGASSSGFAPFVRLLHPQVAVASAGRDNPFGHPRSSVLDMYAEAGSTVLRTDTGGTIVIATDGVRISISSSLRGPR